MAITRFEDIQAWKLARALNAGVYRATNRKGFLTDHDLRRQMRRAATSAMSNIAEGFDSGSDSEFRRFLRIARRSMSELQSHLYAALDQAYIARSEFQDLYGRAGEVKRVIGGFLNYLTKSLDSRL